jgi:hypothetical protein
MALTTDLLNCVFTKDGIYIALTRKQARIEISSMLPQYGKDRRQLDLLVIEIFQ